MDGRTPHSRRMASRASGLNSGDSLSIPIGTAVIRAGEMPSSRMRTSRPASASVMKWSVPNRFLHQWVMLCWMEWVLCTPATWRVESPAAAMAAQVRS